MTYLVKCLERLLQNTFTSNRSSYNHRVQRLYLESLLYRSNLSVQHLESGDDWHFLQCQFFSYNLFSCVHTAIVVLLEMLQSVLSQEELSSRERPLVPSLNQAYPIDWRWRRGVAAISPSLFPRTVPGLRSRSGDRHTARYVSCGLAFLVSSMKIRLCGVAVLLTVLDFPWLGTCLPPCFSPTPTYFSDKGALPYCCSIHCSPCFP